MTYYISKKKEEALYPLMKMKKIKIEILYKHLRLPFLLQGWQWYPSEGEES